MVNRLHFSIEINAEKSQIWDALWKDDWYRDWASVFFEGSYAISDDWKEGSKVLFLSPDHNGIYSIIEKHIPNEIMVFRHLGSVLKGEEQPIDDETKKWSGATEVYSLIEGAESNTLEVEIDVMDEHLEFMQSAFPKALKKVKENCASI